MLPFMFQQETNSVLEREAPFYNHIRGMFSKHVSSLNTIKNKRAVFRPIDGVSIKSEARSPK